MAERNAVKKRLCNNCKQPVVTTAKGIAEHEAKCIAEAGQTEGN